MKNNNIEFDMIKFLTNSGSSELLFAVDNLNKAEELCDNLNLKLEADKILNVLLKNKKKISIHKI